MASSHLFALDIAVLVVYLVIVVGKGVVLGRKQKGLDDYFLAGRKMGWFVVAISIYASLFSAISYMGGPGESFYNDLQYSAIFLLKPLIIPVVLVVFLPFYYRINVYTAYAYLEERFSLPLRLLGSVFFIFWRLTWMALVIYAPALALSEFLGLDWRISILIIGLSSTIYTVAGGMKAVIWTDVMQFFVLVGGILAVAAICINGVEGGLPVIWDVAAQNEKLKMFDFRWDPTLRLSFMSVVIGGFFVLLAGYTVDQVAIQRYLSTSNVREAGRSIIFTLVMGVLVSLLFYWTGVLMWVFYHQHPQLAPPVFAHKDRILPFFIVNQLPVGVRGMLVAALFAATMSSMDSGINSITTATLMDFYDRLSPRRLKEGGKLLLARKWTIFWGVFTTGLALLIGFWGKGLIEMSNTLAGLFTGPLLGVFLLGMLIRRANSWGTLIGAGLGFATAAFIALSPYVQVSFLLYTITGCAITLLVGWCLSYLWSPPTRQQTEGLVYTRGKAAPQSAESDAESPE